jgi:hypothetical protein
MVSRLGQRLRERTLDAMDWVDIRPDPHWTSFASVPIALGLSLYFIPSGFLPLFIVLCVLAAMACLALVLFGILTWIVGWVIRDLVGDGLASMRGAVGQARGNAVVRRPL